MDRLPAQFLHCQSLLQCEAGCLPGHHVRRLQVYNAEDIGRYLASALLQHSAVEFCHTHRVHLYLQERRLRHKFLQLPNQTVNSPINPPEYISILSPLH